MRAALHILLAIEAVVLIMASALHFGLPAPWLAEPKILLAALVEGVCGLLILFAALHGGARTAFNAQAVAFAGVLVSLAALSLTGAVRSISTDLAYILLLAALGPGLVIADRLARPRA